LLGVVAAEQVAVPAQDGVGGDDQVRLPQPCPGESVQQGGEERPVGRGEAGFVGLALQDGELVAQRQNLEVFVRVAHGQQPYEGEDARERQVGQSQQHDRPSWRTRPATYSRIREPAGHSLWMRFSAPTTIGCMARWPARDILADD
jgi:hypothetical protein